uniref:CCHC-type domain-containing protein n=1 Tax=Caenorhabditis tropicalis TaxID=1561998 RepID=A0A1I7T408_9PELO
MNAKQPKMMQNEEDQAEKPVVEPKHKQYLPIAYVGQPLVAAVPVGEASSIAKAAATKEEPVTSHGYIQLLAESAKGSTGEVMKRQREFVAELKDDLILLKDTLGSYDRTQNPSRAEMNVMEHGLFGLYKRCEEDSTAKALKLEELENEIKTAHLLLRQCAKVLEEYMDKNEELDTVTMQQHSTGAKDRKTPVPYGCYFCQSKDHAAQFCDKFPTAKERIEYLNRHSKCHACFKTHGEDKCESRLGECRWCKGGQVHKPMVCPKHSSEAGMKLLRQREEEMTGRKRKLEKSKEPEEPATEAEEDDEDEEMEDLDL